MGKTKKQPVYPKGQEWDVNNKVKLEVWDEGISDVLKVWPTEGNMTALLDADMIPYIVGYCQSEEPWYKALMKANDAGFEKDTDRYFQFLSELKECEDAIDHCNLLVNDWVEGAGCDSALLYLTDGKGNYRNKVAFSKEYKGTPQRNRPKPPFFPLIKWYLVHVHEAIVATENEADDLMAIEQYQRNEELALDGAKQGSDKAKLLSNTVIVTKDKDLRMIPGWHSNPDINNGEPFWVTRYGWLEPQHDKHGKLTGLKGAGLIWFYAQMIIGDAVDNYDGIPGYGARKAIDTFELCADVDDLHEVTLGLYQHKYGTKPFNHRTWTGKTIQVDYMDMFVQQGRLAWMQTKEGEQFMKKHKLPKYKLWRPEK